MTDFYVSITPRETIKMIDNEIVNGSLTGKRIDNYVNDISDGLTLAVLVYEKFYMRSSRTSLTVVIDKQYGKTHIHAVGSGGGEVFKFDWGAADDFEDCVKNALYQYIVE